MTKSHQLHIPFIDQKETLSNIGQSIFCIKKNFIKMYYTVDGHFQ